MSDESIIAPAIGASPITNILLAKRIVRQAPDYIFTATSLPGHLLHFVLKGRVRQSCNGRSYELEPGKVLWYHEDEWVEGEVLEAPWEFYSINFIAPMLVPPCEAARLSTPNALRTEQFFATAVEAWHDRTLSPMARSFRVHAALLGILEILLGVAQSVNHEPAAPGNALWWEIETRVRQNLEQPLDLRQLEQWSHCSSATIARASQAAVGESPMRRIKRIRLSFAQGLVVRSQLTFSEIASRIGYPRVHEFSRDYKRWFGVTPTEERRKFTAESAEGAEE